MWAPAAVVVEAVVAAALREPVVLAAAPLVLVRLLVLADLRLGPAVLVPVHLALPVQRLVPAGPLPLREPAAPLLVQLPVLAGLAVHLVLEAAVPLRRLLSRRSFSAAMAWSSPPPVKPSSLPVRRSR